MTFEPVGRVVGAVTAVSAWYQLYSTLMLSGLRTGTLMVNGLPTKQGGTCTGGSCAMVVSVANRRDMKRVERERVFMCTMFTALTRKRQGYFSYQLPTCIR